MIDAGILLTGGSGKRMRGLVGDKILYTLHGKPIFQYSIEVFCESGLFNELVIVHRDKTQREALETVVSKISFPDMPKVTWAIGGDQRMDSVHNGLHTFQDKPELVFIHDCARPAISGELLNELALEARKHGASCAAHRIVDTMKRSIGNNPFSLENVSRTDLWAMETPQVFRLSEICEGYELAVKQGIHITDDTSALRLTGRKVSLVENPKPNPKLTTPADIDWLGFLLKEEN